MAQKNRSQRWKAILTALTLLALLAFGYALRHQIFDTIRNLGEVNTWALLGILPLVYLNHHSQAKLYQSMLAILRHRIGYKTLLRTSLELNLVNNIFPSGGVSGFSYFSLRMRPLGVSAAQSTLIQMMKYILAFISFQLLLSIGLLALAIDGRANGLLLLVAGSLATLLLVGTLLIAYIIGSKQRISSFFTFITRFLNRLIHVVRPKHPETINISRAREVFIELHESYGQLKQNIPALKVPLLYALLANVAEIMIIYTVYIAFGSIVNPGAVIIAYAVANFAGLVSVLPGGVGIYEALMTAVLAAGGVSPAVSLPVTVMYRVISMSIQLPPGYFLYQRYIHSRDQI